MCLIQAKNSTRKKHKRPDIYDTILEKPDYITQGPGFIKDIVIWPGLQLATETGLYL